MGRNLGDFEATVHLPLARLLGMQVHGCTFHTQAPHGNTAFPVFGRRQTQMLIVRLGGPSEPFVEQTSWYLWDEADP